MLTYANRVAGFGTTIFTEINTLAAQHQAVDLGQGRPDFNGPDAVLQAAAASIHSGEGNQYAPGFGVPRLKANIAAHNRDLYGLELDAAQEIIVTAGATGALFGSIMGTVNAGDEVILIEPFFDIYRPILALAGATPVFVPMKPPTWEFDPDELRAAFNEKTRAIILNTPHNPTGRVYTEDELALIADLCRTHDAIAISDEVYEHLIYDQRQHIPIATLPGMFERTITISSAAKTFSVTGWKVGWACGPAALITGIWRIHQLNVFAINHPGQFGAAAGLALGRPYFDDLKARYAAKRAILRQALAASGLKVTYEPQGAFYICADFSDVFEGDDWDFTRHLIREVGVACIPPTAFFSAGHKSFGQTTVRFAYCKQDAVLHAAAERLAKIC